MYLIDTNVWLHRLLDHDHSEEVAAFLGAVPPSELQLTDFTLHSLGVILSRLNRPQVYLDFVRDVLIEGQVELVSLGPEMMSRLVACMSDENLDFDDAYQYIAAEEESADLVSYDQDFDRTSRRRRSPGEILAEMTAEEDEEEHAEETEEPTERPELDDSEDNETE
jgi:predicted nucleic acid-binding protein